MIMMRRKEEDTRQLYEEKTKSDGALQKYLSFQHSTDARIERKRTTQQTEALRRQIEDELNARRARLAAMLEEEVGFGFYAVELITCVADKMYRNEGIQLSYKHWKKLLICVETA